MHIAIIALGTQGDVQPYIALGKGLKKAGNVVRCKKLMVERLAQAIQKALTDQTMRQRATNLGSKIQAEDGIGNAVTVIQDIEKRGAAYQGEF